MQICHSLHFAVSAVNSSDCLPPAMMWMMIMLLREQRRIHVAHERTNGDDEEERRRGFQCCCRQFTLRHKLPLACRSFCTEFNSPHFMDDIPVRPPWASGCRAVWHQIDSVCCRKSRRRRAIACAPDARLLLVFVPPSAGAWLLILLRGQDWWTSR